MNCKKWLYSLAVLCAAATIILPSLALADDPAPPVVTKSSWGRIKVLYRGTDSTSTAQGQFSIREPGAETYTLTNQATGILWPFGYWEDPANWNGVGGTRTGGGYGTYCGSYRSTHSGADYYSRDLSKKNTWNNGRPVYAGRSGYVIRAKSTDCYGNSVVIWVPGENIQIRYSHLSRINIGENMSIRQGALIGWIGNDGCGSFSPHLHLTVYKGIPLNVNGWPSRVGYLCMSDSYACQVYFYSGYYY